MQVHAAMAAYRFCLMEVPTGRRCAATRVLTPLCPLPPIEGEHLVPARLVQRYGGIFVTPPNSPMPREPREYVATPRKRPAEISLDPPPARIVTPPTRVLASVHTWALDMAPLDPNDADWRAVYAPRVEINLWQLQPSYRDMLVQRMFEGLLMPMTMLTDAHNGPAAAGTLTGLRIVPPREFQFPLMPRAPDLAAAAEIMELWSRPATRLILPRFLLHGTLRRLACPVPPYMHRVYAPTHPAVCRSAAVAASVRKNSPLDWRFL